MTPRQQLIHDALKFADWAAGEGLMPADGKVKGPEDFLLDYSQETGDKDWDSLAERISLKAG